ncbi:MAG: hypothetical protein NTY90_04770 [Candidatus Micrarchaeota archaeon]|nr:hypothetical protein [Candidatus Micrarchaeota archaeon]
MSPQKRGNKSPWAKRLAIVLACAAVVAGIGLFYQYFEGVNIPVTGLFMAEGPLKNLSQDTAKWTQGTFSNTMNVSVTNLTLKQFVNWTQFTPAASPSDRNSFAMAYENNAAIMVLFGGYGTGPLNDTRAYNFSTNNNWTDRNPSTAPSPRYGMKMVYDPLSGRIILFGGTNGTNVFSDTWAYNYSDNTWTLLSPAASPPALYHYSMAYHGSNQSIFLFGGTNGTNVFNELWAFNFTQNTWVNYTTFGVNWPSPRYGAALEYSTSSGTFILDGGYNGTDYLSDTREYYSNTNAWGAKAAGGAKAFHTMLFDQDQGLFLEFGGYTGASYLDSIRTYDVGGDTWSDVTYPAPPPVRANHSMAYYAAQKIFLMFGGNNATGNNGETWTYTPTGSPGYYLNGTYESSTFDAGSSVRWEKIFYNAMVPAGTALSFQLNYSVNGVTWNGWHGPLADPTAYYTSSGQAITSASSAPIQARYMRYKMYLTSNSTQASPVVSNVSFQINYSSALAIWDSMENLPIAQQLNYSRQPVFYANYTGAAGNPVTGATCLFSENSAGSWAADASMAYNASSGLYEYNKTVNPNNLNGAASFNVTCSKTGYASFSLIDQFTIPVFACDQGSLEGGDTCNITQFHYIRVVNYAINGTNLVVKNGAGITRTSGLVSDTTHTFNFSGNVTIENGGFVGEGSGGYLHSIRFFANNYNQAGTIRSSPGGNIDISAANASFSSTAVVSGSTGYIVNVSLAATSFSPGGSWTGADAYYFTLPNWQGNDTSVLYANNPSFNAVPWLEPDSLNCGPAQGSNAKIYGIQCNMAAATRTYEYLNVSGGATVYSAGALSLQVNQNASFYSSSFWHDSNPLGINSTNMAFSNFFFTGSQSIPAYGDVHLNASDTFSGSITAHSTNLLIRANSLNPDAIDTTKKNGAAAGGSGNVSLTAQTINAGTITTVNQYTVFSGYGLPGNVYINATGAVNVASIDARSRGNYGGTIDINAQQINGTTITASGITGPDNPGSGGSIRLNASGPVNVTTITAMGGNRSQFNSGGGNGGSIEINTSGTIKASLISARAGGRYQSSGGSVTLNANGAINVTTISTEDGQLSDFYGGSGGPVTINANGSVTATNIGTGTRTGTSANDGSYSGGPLTINANGSVTVTNIRTASEGGLYYTGQGGAVTINATGQVTVNSIAADGGAKNGAIPAFDGSNADVVTINAGGGVNVSTISSTGGAGYGFGGAGGNLTINANGTINAGTITTSGGSGASYGYGSGGTVRFNANGSVNATTITTAGSPGGPLKINATGNVTAASVNANGGNSNGAVDYLAGKGGDVNINAGSSLRLSQIDVSAGLYSYGTPLDVYGPDGGNVELIAPTITVTTLVRSNGGSAYHTGGGNPHGGSGGIITINSTQQTVVANITSSGGAAYGSTSGTYSFAHGGRGGNILMNSSQILVLGIIQSVGGYAQCTNGAGTSYGGGTGNITVIAQAINGTEIKSIGGDGVGAGGYAGYGGSGGAIRVAAQTINLTTITSTGAVGWNSGGTVASVCGSGGTVELTGQTAYLHQIKVCGASSTEWKVYGGNGGNVTVNLTGTMLIFETIDANGGQGGSTVTGGNAGKINALFSSLLYYGPVTALGGYSPSGSGTNGTINFTRTCRQCSGTYSPDPFFAWAPPTVAGFAKTATWSDIGGVHVNVSAYYWNDSWANNTITETGSADWTGGTYSNASVSINSGNINLSTGNTAGYYEHTIDAGEAVNWDLVKWWTTEPPGTNITMYTSSSNNSYKWTPLDSYSNSSTIAAYGGFYGDFAKAPVSRYLRYRAVFASNDSSKTPFLNEVYITWVNASAAPQLNGARSITLYNSTGDSRPASTAARNTIMQKRRARIGSRNSWRTGRSTRPRPLTRRACLIQ